MVAAGLGERDRPGAQADLNADPAGLDLEEGSDLASSGGSQAALEGIKTRLRHLVGSIRNFVCVGRAVDPVQAMARVKRSPKRMANWALAMHHSRAGMVHSFSDRFKTKNSSFRAASSVGK